MILEDLEYIFKPQVNEGTDSLYFMLIVGEYKLIQRHPSNDMTSLLPMLDSFQYAGTQDRIPRFMQ
jgi:hypothetical protein